MGFAAMDARMDARIGWFRASMDNTLMRQTLLDMKCPWMPALTARPLHGAVKVML
jgi:hypothetical protein